MVIVGIRPSDISRYILLREMESSSAALDIDKSTSTRFRIKEHMNFMYLIALLGLGAARLNNITLIIFNSTR